MKCCFSVLVLLLASAFAAEGDSEDLHLYRYTPPTLKGSAFLVDTFDNGFGSRWVKSEAKKEGAEEDLAKYNGEWKVAEPEKAALSGDVGLILTTKARHAAISAKLDKPFKFDGKPLVVQYEVMYSNGMECGGSYIKLLSEQPNLDLKQVTDKTGYTIMFGPDTCGADKKLHFIMRHKNPRTGEFEEKHAKKPSGDVGEIYTDKKTHLVRLTVKPDQTWEMHVDEALVNSGSLLEDMEPSVNPPKEIPDPEDFKPEDWDDRKEVEDPDATKPIDWDEDAPEFLPDSEAVKPDGWLDDEKKLIPDPEAKKPDDWDDDMDGEWEAPLVENPLCAAAPGCGEWERPNKRNPDYRGKWRSPMVPNPHYSGIWSPRNIPNPDFFEDTDPYKMTPIGAVTYELWSMSDGIVFDNLLITDDTSVAEEWTSMTFQLKRNAELAQSSSASGSLTDWITQNTEERPWLWAVFIVALLVPVCLIAYCCCMGSKDEPAERKKTDEPAERKKTDEPTADDEQEEEISKPASAEPVTTEQVNTEQVNTGQAAGDASVSEKTPSKKGRAALNKTDDDDEEDVTGEADSGPDSQADEQPVEKTEAGVRTSPRKRKLRKE